MQMKHEDLTIQELLELFKNQMLKANPEYQRGLVWTRGQRKKLIDSVMRGYPLPLMYFHHIKRSVAGMHREDLEIIDGQQRINSLNEFAQGAWKLFDPKQDDAEAKFPEFIKKQACPWGGRDFGALSEDLRTRF